MYTARIRTLSNFLLEEQPTDADLLAFICNATLLGFDAQALYLVKEVAEETFITAKYFIFQDQRIQNCKITLPKENKFRLCIENQDLLFGDIHEIQERGEISYLTRGLVIGEESQKYLAIPVGKRAALLVLLSGEHKLTASDKEFFSVIGCMMAVFIYTHLELTTNGRVLPIRTLNPTELASLSPRQNEIIVLVHKGMTNQEISRAIGYSESLVRQELVKIFRSVGFNSRHDVQKMDLSQLCTTSSTQKDGALLHTAQ